MILIFTNCWYTWDQVFYHLSLHSFCSNNPKNVLVFEFRWILGLWAVFFKNCPSKGPPLQKWKMKIIRYFFLIAQMKRLDALNATQKTSALCKVLILKKSRKTAKKAHFWKIVQFWQFFLIFSESVLYRELRFFALHSVHQDASFELSKSINRWFSGHTLKSWLHQISTWIRMLSHRLENNSTLDCCSDFCTFVGSPLTPDFCTFLEGGGHYGPWNSFTIC